MHDKPNTAASEKPRRRWFQFRLRTLLIGMMLLAVPCGYMGWQAKIVRERKGVLELVVQQGGTISPLINAPPDDLPPLVRRLLGDEPIGLIEFQQPITTEELQSIAAAFPEADIKDGKRVTGPAIHGTPPS